MSKPVKQKSPELRYQPKFFHSIDFAFGFSRREWLVESILIDGEPGVIVGPPKCLKTSVAVDLAISLSTGVLVHSGSGVSA